MSEQETGNLFHWVDKHDKNRGWFLGPSSFIEIPWLQSENVEVKWNVKKRGWKHTQPQKHAKRTITILISGKVEIYFPSLDKKNVLSKQGDFSFHDSETMHITTVLEDCTTITIRY
ncbi:MAG: hypothetical protein CO029_02250 [Candidatus Magasanikbacteria bacterium CG_4_9_14_0_2_um_filter_41_10]|uniref:Cupin n=1 Tax=Candidatus Magasanikbacteria bacterium CG_4_10_14_0_2_um_filter_41_31 TaxID=1974639 RepID=A0A2M7V2R2_9BACT|nr:MAG: hypothetical protein AUJ37_04915 [Candidatus Magasanikbacteria bacterium CG1_02_41_34]PIZ92743.1 MAG: hypothetical protein COX83_03645 [Candidatus Magasanikbacteria bacterium CG_4_10_14_0_2_um_filter_41_31]PJC53540.1 MAG: hypothetical protein CO029_02250 [Candidatus Magasanikbacteria bacterium CG_4_9_14_0_2_um_filter_41_10]